MSERDKRIATISKARMELMEATTPQETKQIEALSAAAKQWAKENGFFEGVVEASQVHILARRKTAELIRPLVVPVGTKRGSSTPPERNRFVADLDADFGITPAQWNRRLEELRVSEEELHDYFDTCIESHWEPTYSGLVMFARNPAKYKEAKKALGLLDQMAEAFKEVNRLGHLLGSPTSPRQAREHLGYARQATAWSKETTIALEGLIKFLEKQSARKE